MDASTMPIFGIIVGWILGIFTALVGGVFSAFRDAMFSSQRLRIELLQNALQKCNHAFYVFAVIGREQKLAALGGEKAPPNSFIERRFEHYVQLLDEGFESLSNAIGNLLACGYSGPAQELRAFNEKIFEKLGELHSTADASRLDQAMSEYTATFREEREKITTRISNILREEGRLRTAIRRHLFDQSD